MKTKQQFTLPPQDIQREYITSQIADSLERMIITEGMQPGTRLPSEKDLSKYFGVTKITVGTAMGLLEQRGLVERKVGSGTYVKKISQTVITETVSRYFHFGHCSYDELTQIRNSLEPTTAELAAMNATPVDLKRLGELVAVMEGFLNSKRREIKEFATVDADFHAAIAVATHNKLLRAIMAALHQLVKTWIEVIMAREMTPEEIKDSEAGIRSHRAVYEAIVSRDPKLARESMQHHMLLSREKFRDLREDVEEALENKKNYKTTSFSR